MNIAIVGSGHLAKRYYSMLKTKEEVTLVGIISRQIHQERSEFKMTPIVTSLEELPDLDIVVICTPTFTHLNWIEKAAARGAHIICEKPLALSSEEARVAIDCCKKAGVHLLVGHTLRFFPEYKSARREVLNGKIGRPGLIRMSRATRAPAGRNAWYKDESKSGGLFLDLAVHDLDWIHWTFGNVERLTAKRVAKDEEGSSYSYGLIILRLVSGAICHVEVSWAANEFQTSFELTGDRGLLTSESANRTPLKLTVRDQAEAKEALLPTTILAQSPYETQLNHFIRVIGGQEESCIIPDEALYAIEMAEAAIKSSRTGHAVTLGKGDPHYERWTAE
ncbi:Gfo/Idh/MocA family protein [Shouchella shacheensis]|uniref:Gfo/Idh/MocA family protein n=1 Tax=Shouchella shacheensis TaxID=1649580 RepID=UPI00073FE33D|nr:Gfo/Idh/MocA family oxidoreductase [Shouchella shacheensis]